MKHSISALTCTETYRAIAYPHAPPLWLIHTYLQTRSYNNNNTIENLLSIDHLFHYCTMFSFVLKSFYWQKDAEIRVVSYYAEVNR